MPAAGPAPARHLPRTTGGPQRALTAGIVALLLAAGGCAKKSEAEQLAALREGFTYKRYQQVSGTGLPTALEAYRKASELSGKPVEPFTAEELCVARTLLAYSALTFDKQTLVIAESDLIDRNGCDALTRHAAQSLRVVVFQRRSWHGLAHEHSQVDPAGLGDARKDAMARLAALHLVLIYTGAMDKRWDRVVLQVEGLAALIGTPWLGEIGNACLDIHEGRTRDGLRRIKRLSENPHVPEQVRTELATAIAAFEAEAGNLDDSMTRLLLRMVWLAIRDHGPERLRMLAGFVEDNAWNRLASAPDDLRAGLSERWRRWRADDEVEAPDKKTAAPAPGVEPQPAPATP